MLYLQWRTHKNTTGLYRLIPLHFYVFVYKLKSLHAILEYTPHIYEYKSHIYTQFSTWTVAVSIYTNGACFIHVWQRLHVCSRCTLTGHQIIHAIRHQPFRHYMNVFRGWRSCNSGIVAIRSYVCVSTQWPTYCAVASGHTSRMREYGDKLGINVHVCRSV